MDSSFIFLFWIRIGRFVFESNRRTHGHFAAGTLSRGHGLVDLF